MGFEIPHCFYRNWLPPILSNLIVIYRTGCDPEKSPGYWIPGNDQEKASCSAGGGSLAIRKKTYIWELVKASGGRVKSTSGIKYHLDLGIFSGRRV
jgi:hypothetical protein